MEYYIYMIASILILPCVIYGFFVSNKVNKTFNAYKSVNATCNKTAKEVAESMLNTAGITNVRIEKISGNLTDNYNPRTKVLILSDSTYNSTSVAAIGVAAHEVGHAIQHHQNYAPVKIRTGIVPFVNLFSRLALPILVVGMVLDILSISTETGLISNNIGEVLIWIAVAFYASSTIFALVTLGVEKDASKRALENLNSQQLLTYEELPQAKSVLDAAGKTYFASLLISFVYFLRFLSYALIFLGRRKD